MSYPGGGMEFMLRSMRRGQAVEKRKIGRETALRILSFAKPYRRDITVFLLVIIVSAAIGVATPLLAGDVVRLISSHKPDAAADIIKIALVIAGLAVVSATLSLFDRWYSSRIGEGLI